MPYNSAIVLPPIEMREASRRYIPAVSTSGGAASAEATEHPTLRCSTDR